MTYNPAEDSVSDLMSSENWGVLAGSLQRSAKALDWCATVGGFWAARMALIDPPVGLGQGLLAGGALLASKVAGELAEIAEEQRKAAEQAEAERQRQQAEAERKTAEERARQALEHAKFERDLKERMDRELERMHTREYWREYRDPPEPRGDGTMLA